MEAVHIFIVDHSACCTAGVVEYCFSKSGLQRAQFRAQPHKSWYVPEVLSRTGTGSAVMDRVTVPDMYGDMGETLRCSG